MPRRRPLGGGGRGRRISVKFVKNLTPYRACKGAKPGRTGKIVKFKKKLKVDGGLKIGVGDKTICTNEYKHPRTFQELSKNFPRISKMSAVELPVASAVESKTAASAAAASEPVEVETVLAALKTLETADLFKVLKQALAAAEKRSTAAAPRGKAAVAAKKAGSMPKGVVPPQLRKPRAWVDFTLHHALENGWESFTVFQTKKDKETGEKIDEEIEMSASVLHEGAHVYDGSVTEKTPAGKQLIHKDAMSLSKQRWAPKDKKGTHGELYEEFETAYVEEEVDVPETASVASSKVVVKMTSAEKTAAAEAKKEAKALETAAKKEAKALETAAKKAEKEAEKIAKKAEKEAEKEAKKAEKEAAKKPSAKAPVPAAAVKKAAASAVKAAPVKASAASAVKAPVKKPVAAAKKEEWSCPSDGMVHPWPYKGKQYLRNSDNEVWLKGADGGCGEWQGVYLPAEDSIDDSVAEPVFEDEE